MACSLGKSRHAARSGPRDAFKKVLPLLAIGGMVAGIVVTGARAPTLLDQRVAAWFSQRVTGPGIQLAELISFFGSPVFLTATGFGMAIFLLSRRAWYAAAAFILAVGGGALLNQGLKILFHRPRPFLVHPMINSEGYGFPSGHTLGVTLFGGFLVIVVTHCTKLRHQRTATVLLALIAVLLMGLSRLYLGVHYLSDVAGGAAVGLAWLTMCVLSIEALRRHHARANSPRSDG